MMEDHKENNKRSNTNTIVQVSQSMTILRNSTVEITNVQKNGQK